MTRKLPEMIRRKRAIEATMDKFRLRPFDWKGRVTCVHMLAFHLRKMGHRPPPVPHLTGAPSALRELRKRGFDGVDALLDSLLVPIPPAAMRPGDVATWPSEDGFGAVFVSIGAKAIGWVAGEPLMQLVDPVGFTKAWRV